MTILFFALGKKNRKIVINLFSRLDFNNKHTEIYHKIGMVYDNYDQKINCPVIK